MQHQKTTLIGVAGGSGSGKTTICNMLYQALGDRCRRLSSDDYYRAQGQLSVAERTEVNYDHPAALDLDLLQRQLERLRQGETVEVPQYDFVTHNRSNETTTLAATSIILVEGILIFSRPELRSLFDLRIFVDASPATRLSRRMQRDITDRGRTSESVRGQWQATLEPMFQQFVAPTQEFADLVVNTEFENSLVVDLLAAGVLGLIG